MYSEGKLNERMGNESESGRSHQRGCNGETKDRGTLAGDGRRRVGGKDRQGKSDSWHGGSLEALDFFGKLETW